MEREENAIAIVMDGGGCQPYFNEYPNYQEVETIYKLQPDTVPVKQYQRLSNYRNLSELNGEFFWENDMGHIHRAPDLEIEKDGSQIVFSSKPSMGMNFSSLSLYLGFDKLGRAELVRLWVHFPLSRVDRITRRLYRLVNTFYVQFTATEII